MKAVTTFLGLVRWPNLVFIFLTQLIFRKCILLTTFYSADIEQTVTEYHFFLIVCTYVLIAAAGYIINDYFDLDIDLINKPGKVFITNGISKRQALIWYAWLNIGAIACSVYVDLTSTSKMGGISATICVLLLYFYSRIWKKRFLIGNVLVAAITAWSITVLTCLEGNLHWPAATAYLTLNMNEIFLLTILYTAFAFIVSLIREVVKDMEDISGDRQYGCRTMPIVWGIRASRNFVAICLVVLILMLIVTGTYLKTMLWWPFIVYTLLFILIPLLRILIKLFQAQQAADFNKLSKHIKLVMLTGILSMIFFKYMG
jgi:4-hydroxybenzoate polyprenyltransferase